jgi:hypothetical protein
MVISRELEERKLKKEKAQEEGIFKMLLLNLIIF